MTRGAPVSSVSIEMSAAAARALLGRALWVLDAQRLSFDGFKRCVTSTRQPSGRGQPRRPGQPRPQPSKTMRRRGVRRLCAAAALQQAAGYPFPIPGGEPGVWGVHDGDEWFTRHCRKRELEKCKETYERCARDAPAGEGYAAHMCTCADEYYGVCARKSGCSSILMKQCVDEMDKWGGCDSSVCGRTVLIEERAPYHLTRMFYP